MKATRYLWMKRLAASAVAVALPLAVMAHGAGTGPQGCPPPHIGGPMVPPPPGLLPALPPAGHMPMPPYLHDIELTEAQRDKLFALMHEQAPGEREQMKAAFKAMNELRRLAAMDRFDADQARQLADAHAQALSRVAMMHAELEAKLRALLTPEQRKQLDDVRELAGARKVAHKCS